MGGYNEVYGSNPLRLMPAEFDISNSEAPRDGTLVRRPRLSCLSI